MVQPDEETTLTQRREAIQTSEIGYEPEGDTPGLRLVEQVRGGARLHRLRERGSDFVDPRIGRQG